MADGVFPVPVPERVDRRRRQKTAEWFAHNCRMKFDQAPKRIGTRTLVRVIRRLRSGNLVNGWGDHEYAAVVVCDCWAESTIALGQWEGGHSGLGCKSCVRRKRNAVPPRSREQTDACAGQAVQARRAAWLNLPAEQDQHFQAFRQAFPEGATLEQVADFYGLTRERIRQIESAALSKLKRGDKDGRLAELLRALRERETGPRDRGTGIGRHALTMDELPTLAGITP